MENNLLLGIVIMVFSTLIGSTGAFFFKYTSKGKNLFDLLKNKFFYLGLIFYGVASLIFVFALKFGDLSDLYPIVGLSHIWISLLSMKFLKEKINDYRWFGILMIIIGVVFAGLGA